MSKFHVGDRVRITADALPNVYGVHVANATGTVVEHNSDFHLPYVVELDLEGSPRYAFQEYLLRPEKIVPYQDALDAFHDLKSGDPVVFLSGVPSGEDGNYQEGDQVKIANYIIQDAVDVVNHPPHYNRFP